MATNARQELSNGPAIGLARWLGRIGYLAGMILLAAAAAVHAQIVRPPRSPSPLEALEPHRGEEPPPLPEFPPEPPAEPFVLPPVAPAPPDRIRAPEARVFVRAVRVVSNTVLDEEELKAAVAPYLDRALTAGELERLRRELTLLYVNQGYISSGAVLPDQRVADGVVTFQVVEGRLSRIEFTGLERLKPEYVRDRIDLDADVTLRLHDLEEGLQRLYQDRLIEQVSGQLTPGNRLGESVLTVAVKERRPYTLSFRVLPVSLRDKERIDVLA